MPRHRSLRLRLEHILKGIARIEQLTEGSLTGLPTNLPSGTRQWCSIQAMLRSALVRPFIGPPKA